MKHKYFYLVIALVISNVIYSQVGVGTTAPEETLHVNGTLRVETLKTSQSTKVIGLDSDGSMNEVVIGDNIELKSGVLSAIGTTHYFIENVDMTTIVSGQVFNNIDLDLSGANKDKVVFRLINANHNFEVTGISGGTDGKHIILLNVTANNFRLSDNSILSLPQNRITTLAGSFEATSGVGAAELVYDEILQRWIILNFRN